MQCPCSESDADYAIEKEWGELVLTDFPVAVLALDYDAGKYNANAPQ